MNGEAEESRRMLPRAKKFRPHIKIYAGVVAAALALNFGLGLGLPLFWPIALWSTVLSIHYFIASSLDVDEVWIQDRIDDMRVRSYDFDHIRDIRDRVNARDDTVTHHEERDR